MYTVRFLLSYRYKSNLLFCNFLDPPEHVKIRQDPPELKPYDEATLICDSSSSNPPAKLSWWVEGIPVKGLANTTVPGLHGGTVSSIELKINVTEKINGVVYTCQASNEALQRSVHNAITLQVLCKFFKINLTLIIDFFSFINFFLPIVFHQRIFDIE